jgi:formyltetrahydrofolate deformylase
MAPAVTGSNVTAILLLSCPDRIGLISRISHFVFERGGNILDLDDGPIIDQDVIRISHKDSVSDLIRKGRELERMILSRALYFHAEHRILVHGKKTIIFD